MRRSWLAALAASVLLTAVLLLAAGSTVRAQDPDGGQRAESSDILVDDETGERYRLERPPEGMQRGDLPVPSWVPVAAGVLVVLAAAGALLLRARRRKA